MKGTHLIFQGMIPIILMRKGWQNQDVVRDVVPFKWGKAFDQTNEILLYCLLGKQKYILAYSLTCKNQQRYLIKHKSSVPLVGMPRWSEQQGDKGSGRVLWPVMQLSSHLKHLSRFFCVLTPRYISYLYKI